MNMGAPNLPEVIMVAGSLTKDKTVQLSLQVDAAISRLQQQTDPSELILVFDSSGGSYWPTFETLINKIRKASVPTAAKIYRAASAAAMLALATTRREITESGSFALHDGQIEVAASDIFEGRLVTPVLKSLLRMSDLNRDLMLANKLELTDAMSDRLSATGLLELNPEECMKLGIVSRIV